MKTKVTKTRALYQYHPKGNDKCSTCTMFRKSISIRGFDSCTKVEGVINPSGWCKFYYGKDK